MTHNFSGFLHPEHSQSAKNEAARDAFTDVVSPQKDGTIVVDLSALPADADVIIKGADTVASVEFQAEESATPTPKAFEPGHVFKAYELPEDKQHLNGALYFADNEDGSMRIISKELYAGRVSWRWLKSEINITNDYIGEGAVRIGTQRDWDSLMQSAFADKAGLYKCSEYDRESLYWQDTEDPLGQPTHTRLFCSVEALSDVQFTGHKISSRAYGRFFADVPRFEPVA